MKHGFIGKTIVVFAALVGFYFILMYPEKLVELLQVFVDGAHRIATALGGLDTKTPE